MVVKVYTDSFDVQMRLDTWVTAFGMLAALATWQRNPVSMEEVQERQKADMGNRHNKTARIGFSSPLNRESFYCEMDQPYEEQEFHANT